MSSLATLIRRHGIARTGRLGARSRMGALAMSAMGDPRFSFKRAFTIPRKVRQGVMGGAFNLLGALPGGSLVQGFMGSHPSMFPNVPQLAGSGTGPGSMTTMPMLSPVPGGSNVNWEKLHKAFKHPGRMAGAPRRRMNFANSRALGRAERRVGGFIRHYTKTARALGLHVTRKAAHVRFTKGRKR